MGRLRRGHSLEVIFEEETAEFQPSIARLEEEELTDEWKNYRRLSRRQILFQQQQESGPGSSSSSVQVTLCSQCCHPTEMDSGSTNPTMDQTTTTTTTTVSHIPARRRNSTYLALACANAVSQGAMTRSLRQMFETQPVRETQPLLSRAEIKQQIQAARLRRNSIAVLYPSGASGSPEQQPDDIVTAIPAVVVDAVPTKQQPPATPAKPTTTTTTAVSSAPSTPLQFKLPASPVTDNAPVDMSSPLCIRCDKCSSILTSPPVAVSLVIHSGKSFSSAVTQPPTTTVHQEITAEEEKPMAVVEERAPSPSKIIPTNREVLEEELPKPDTVKNARCLFESSFMEASSSSHFGTLQHVKSNPSSKILRSESSMTLDRAGTRSSSVASRPSPFRWPSRQEHARNRSPSPSPSPSPIPALVIPAVTKSHHHKITSSTLPSYYRSSPSLTQYRSSRHSLHSTDVESYVSEGGSDCWSSSDLESEASYSSVSGGGGGGGRDDSLSDSLDGMRYISPDVMEKIRSYGMTLTFVNGKMVDEEDDDQEEPEVSAKEAATRKVVQSIRSAGQSQPITATSTPAPVAPTKSAIKQQTKEKLLKSASPPPRIVACLPKQETVEKANNNNNNQQQQLQFTKKIRHSSGESSASSGVSSGTNAGSDSSSSEHNSPFASLKRTKSANADHTVERSPSPGPRQSGTRKAVGSSPFGCYSVVYSFNASARSPMYV